MPAGWEVQAPLGPAEASAGAWYGFGLWSADQHGPPANFVDSLGFGNSLTGNGFHLEGGLRKGSFSFAAELVGGKDRAGATFLDLYRGHATWRSREQGGWMISLEREPLVWGYGLNGGYLLSDAARPVPRLRLETPMVPLRVFKVPLGTWGFQAFMGRLEGSRTFSTSLQDPLLQENRLALEGQPQAPFLNGYRLQARFGENIEFYANYLTMWGGSLNGQSLTQGYSLGDYATAMFGLKDALAEANTQPGAPLSDPRPYVNKARSGSNSDLGFRVRIRYLEGLLEADTVHAYLSRGSKNVYWNAGHFLADPPRYWWKDLSNDTRDLLGGHPGYFWNRTDRYSVPNLATPNDTVGILLAWPGIRVGVEYLDTVNNQAPWVRSFSHGIYLSGFYYHGDPLGQALGGESRTSTVRLEARVSPRLSSTTLIQLGERPFRDDPDLWNAAHPGLTPRSDRFIGWQQTLRWRMAAAMALELGASWQRHTAVDNVPGQTANGFRYHADLSYRWPAPVR